MSLIGIIASKKDIKEINKKLKEKCELIEITNKSISNLKNIKFEEIIINKDIKMNEDEYKFMSEILENTDYIIKNADVKIDLLEKIKLTSMFKENNVISYGFNPKATISISSVRDDYMIVSILKEIEKSNKEKIENQEKKIEYEKNVKIYNKLIIFIINELHKFNS